MTDIPMPAGGLLCGAMTWMRG